MGSSSPVGVTISMDNSPTNGVGNPISIGVSGEVGGFRVSIPNEVGICISIEVNIHIGVIITNGGISAANGLSVVGSVAMANNMGIPIGDGVANGVAVTVVGGTS